MTREGIKEYLMQINEAPEPINRWKPDILCELIDQIYHDFEEGIDKALKIAEENGYHDAYDLLMDIKENR